MADIDTRDMEDLLRRILSTLENIQEELESIDERVEDIEEKFVPGQ